MTKFLTFLLMAGLAFPALLDAAQDGKGTNMFESVVIKDGRSFTFGGVTRTNWPTGGGDVYLGSNNVFAANTTQTFFAVIIGGESRTNWAGQGLWELGVWGLTPTLQTNTDQAWELISGNLTPK